MGTTGVPNRVAQRSSWSHCHLLFSLFCRILSQFLQAIPVIQEILLTLKRHVIIYMKSDYYMLLWVWKLKIFAFKKLVQAKTWHTNKSGTIWFVYQHLSFFYITTLLFQVKTHLWDAEMSTQATAVQYSTPNQFAPNKLLRSPEWERSLLVSAQAVSVNGGWARHSIQMMGAIGKSWNPLAVSFGLLFPWREKCSWRGKSAHSLKHYSFLSESSHATLTPAVRFVWILWYIFSKASFARKTVAPPDPENAHGPPLHIARGK